MSERDGCGDGQCSDGATDFIPPRASRARRSGVVPPGGGPDSDAILLESVKAAPRRSSIIKVKGPRPESTVNGVLFVLLEPPKRAQVCNRNTN